MLLSYGLNRGSPRATRRAEANSPPARLEASAAQSRTRTLEECSVKIRTRIATAVTVALASVFIAAPAFASGGGDNADSTLSSAGDPLNYAGIAAVGIVLLLIVLVSSKLVGDLFEKKS